MIRSPKTEEYPTHVVEKYYTRYLLLPKEMFRELGLTMGKEVTIVVKKDKKNPLNSDIKLVFRDPVKITKKRSGS